MLRRGPAAVDRVVQMWHCIFSWGYKPSPDIVNFINFDAFFKRATDLAGVVLLHVSRLL